MSFDLSRGGFFKFGFTDDQLADLLVLGQLAVHVIDLILDLCIDRIGIQAFKLFVVRIYKGGNDDIIIIRQGLADNDSFRNDLDLCQIFFDFLGEYILTVAENDNVLFSAGNENETVLVDSAKVAGEELAVF